LDQTVRRMGPQHFAVVRLKGEIADIYEELGHWTESEPLRRDVYTAYVQHRGKENDFTVGKEYLLSLSLLELGRTDEARNHLLRILEIRERLYDPQDKTTQTYRNLLASIGPLKTQDGIGSQTANALTSFQIETTGRPVPSATSTTGGVRRARRPPKATPPAPDGPNDS
jgi:hypothetical protein